MNLQETEISLSLNLSVVNFNEKTIKMQ